jgi:ABC-type glycerol-3-phosphate transport system permease component
MTAQEQAIQAAADLPSLLQPPGSWSRRLRQAALHVLVGGAGIIFAFPFFWMILTSFKREQEILSLPPTFIPKSWTFDNYYQAVTYIPFFRYLLNTLFISGVYAAGTVISCSLVAFSCSRVRWPGREILFLIVLSTMLLPGEVTLIPVYVIFKNLGWVGTFAPLTVPAFLCGGTARYIFLLRQFFRTIPFE